MIERLRLKAVDADDLSVMAACLQDALIPLSEMVYLPEERRFLAAFTRFRRECLEDPEDRAGLTQCQAVLTFSGVLAVRHHAVDRRFGAVRMELLTVIAEPAVEGGASITLIFAGDAAIQLQVERIAATLVDIGEPWAAPATPSHELPPEGA
jgi:hypothetical protein